MNTVITFYDHVDEWYQGTYICCECEEEFMTYREKAPRFCPGCGVKFDALGYITRQSMAEEWKRYF